MEVLMNNFKKLMLLVSILMSTQAISAAARRGAGGDAIDNPTTFMACLFTHTDGNDATVSKNHTDIVEFLATEQAQNYLNGLRNDVNPYNGSSTTRMIILNAVVKAAQLAVSSLVADTTNEDILAAIRGQNVDRLNLYGLARHDDIHIQVANENNYATFTKVKLLAVVDALPDGDKAAVITGLQAASGQNADKTVGFWVLFRNIKNSVASVFSGGVKAAISQAWNGFKDTINNLFALVKQTVDASKTPVRAIAAGAGVVA